MDENKLFKNIINPEDSEEKKKEVERLDTPEEHKNFADELDKIGQQMLEDEREMSEGLEKLEKELGPDHEEVIALREALDFLREQIEMNVTGFEEYIEDFRESDELITLAYSEEIAIPERVLRIEAIRTELENITDDKKAEELAQELDRLTFDQAIARSKNCRI
jgi:uncharacterized coiled-coil DUF342 family protein